MTTIYVVTRGEYSDYGICRAFSTRGLAEQWLSALPTNEMVSKDRRDTNADYPSGYRIEEFSLDDMSDPPVSHCHVVLSLESGDVLSARYSEGGFATISVDKTIVRSGGYLHVKSVHVSVPTHEEERAVKVANEKRTQLIALGRTAEGRYDYATLEPMA